MPGLAPASPICAATMRRTFSVPGSCWANVVTRSGRPEMANGDASASRRFSSDERRDRARRRQHEGLARPYRDVVATHLDVDPVAVADAVARALLDAEQVVRGDLRGKPLENRLSRAGNVVQASARHRGNRLEALHQDPPVLGFGRRLFGDRHVSAAEIHRHHVDRGARGSGESNEVSQIVGLRNRQPLGDQDERLRAVNIRPTARATAAGHEARGRRPRASSARSATTRR